ncbi:response regulator transcription factor (plasmid) [Nostoc sp. UHCC 0926]|uniref:response regulator n=1 Tax=Nostoc sp. UHCC 0926 TaxID=3025190 RepID=UPI002360815F|nr:response regulator transcription factor [Nostoc sp. UHCC 0926]WDD30211.1 response regulator transcription factor [Nostoc sp. UHCC 0926]
MLKIVIIEREPFTLLGIKTAISQSPDIEVSGEATCGEIGLKLIEETKPDVVLVDLLLPDMSGLELTHSIKKKTNTKVVIFTNQAHEDVVNSAFIYGADSYMLKTTDIELIELAIKRAYFPKLTKKILESRYQNRESPWRCTKDFLFTQTRNRKISIRLRRIYIWLQLHCLFTPQSTIKPKNS